MLRNLFETLRFKFAVRDHNTKHKKRVLEVMPSRAELDAIEALRATGTHSQTRIRQAALLEAHDVSEELVHLLCKANAEGRVTRETLNQLYEHGMRLEFHLAPTMREQIRDMAKVERLQKAVKQLAFIAGPGFTTQHLVDEGLLNEGDI